MKTNFLSFFFIFLFLPIYSEIISPQNLTKLFIASPDNEQHIIVAKKEKLKIFTNNQTGYFNIYLQYEEKDGGTITKQLFNTDFSDKTEPSYSEKENIIVYTSNKDDVRGNIELIRLSDNYEIIEKKILTDAKTEDKKPFISNDGKRILYIETDLSGKLNALVLLTYPDLQKKKIIEKNIFDFTVFENSIIFITKSNDLWVLEFFDLNSGKSDTIISSNYRLQNPFFDDDKKFLYFSKILNNQSILFRLNFALWQKEKKVFISQITPSNFNLLNPIYYNNSLYFISSLNSSNNNYDIFKIENINNFFEFINNLKFLDLVNLISLKEISDENKIIIISNYLSENYRNFSDEYKKKIISQIFSYFSFVYDFEKFNEILNENFYINNYNIKNFDLVKIYFDEINYYFSIKNKSNFEKENITKNFIKELEEKIKIYQDTEIQIKLKETLADAFYNSEKFSEAIKIYDDIFYSISDNKIKAKIQYKKSFIFKKLKDNNNYKNILISFINNYPTEKPYIDYALNDLIDFFKKEKRFIKKIDIINYLIELSNQYKNIPLLSINCLFESAKLSFDINENFIAKRNLEIILNDFTDYNNYIVDALILLGDIYFQESNYKLSFDYYQTALNKGYQNKEKYSLAKNKYLEKQFKKGEFEYFIKDFEKSYKTFFQLIEFDSSYIKAHREFVKIGVLLNKINELEKYYEQKIKDNPTNSAFYYGYALLITYKNDFNYKTALSYLNKALKYTNNNPFIYMLKGWLYEQAEMVFNEVSKLEDAIANYKIALNLLEKDDVKTKSELFLNIGNAYYYLKNYEFAFRFFSARLDLLNLLPLEYFDSEREAIFYERIANSAYYLGYSEKAEPFLHKAIELIKSDDKKIELLQRLSLIYYTMNKYEDTLKTYDLVINKELKKANDLRKHYLLRNKLFFYVNYFSEKNNETKIEQYKNKKNLIKLYEDVLNNFNAVYKQVEKEKEGLLNISFNLSNQSTSTGGAFDKLTENKFIFTIGFKLFSLFNDDNQTINILLNRLKLIPEKFDAKKQPAIAIEKLILLNNLSVKYLEIQKINEALNILNVANELAIQLNDNIGIYVNLVNYAYLINQLIDKIDVSNHLDKFINTYKFITTKNIYYDFLVLNSYSALCYKYYLNNLQNLEIINDTFEDYQKYLDVTSKYNNFIKYLKYLDEQLNSYPKKDELLKIFYEINKINLSLLKENKLKENIFLKWYKYWQEKDYKNAEEEFFNFIKLVSKYSDYNFLNKDLIKAFFIDLINEHLNNNDLISIVKIINNYHLLLNAIYFKKDLANIQFLTEEDIYYLQSLLRENENIFIVINAKKIFIIKINQSEIIIENEIDKANNANNYLLLFHTNNFDDYKYDFIHIPSISAFIRSKETQTIYLIQKKEINDDNFTDLVNYDILKIITNLEINTNNLNKTKFYINNENYFCFDLIKRIVENNINYLILNTSDFDFKNIDLVYSFLNEFFFSNFSNIIFGNIDNINERNKLLTEKKIIIFGANGFNEDEIKEIAQEKINDLILEATENYRNNAFGKALLNTEKILYLDNILNFSNEEKIKYFKLAVNCSYKSEDYNKAIYYQNHLLNLLNKNDENYYNEIYNLGIFYSLAENYDSSIFYFNKALIGFEKNPNFKIKALVELSKSQEFKGNYNEAITFLNKTINEDKSQEALFAQYIRLGRIYYLRLNDYLTALDYFEKAKDLVKSDDKLLCQTLIYIGLVKERIIGLEEARTIYNEAIKINKKINDKDIEAELLLNIANTYWYEGDYKQAIEYAFKALDICKKNKNEQLEYIIYNTIGLIYWTLNNFEKSIYYLENSLLLSSKLKFYNDVASTYNNLGLVYRSQKNYNEAIDYFNKAIEIDKNLMSKWALGYDYRNLGITYLLLNDLKKANEYLFTAYDYSSKINDYVNLAKTMLELGNLYTKLNDTKLALDWFDKTLEIAKKHNLQEVEWRALFGKGICFINNDKEIALTYLEKSIDVIEKMRTALKIEELKNSFIINKDDVYDKIISLLIEIKNIEKAHYYLERGKSRSLIDLLGNHKIKFKSEEANKLYKKLLENKKQIDVLLSKLANEKEENKKKELNKQIEKLSIENSEVLLKMKINNPELESLVTVSVQPLKEIQQSLQSEINFIEYYYNADWLYIWIINKNDIKFEQAKIKGEYLDNLIIQYNNRIQKITYIEDLSQELYKILILPIEKYLTNTKYICIIPHNKLHYLSFASLNDGKNYLIDKYPLFYLSSLSLTKYVFSEPKKKEKTRLKILSIGNPDLGDLNYELPLARLEAISIKWEFPEIDILLDTEAKISSVVKNISKYNVIHIASHGEFNSINPLFSALKLTPDDLYDGDLKALDVFNLELKADLVTLSACQSGLGKIAGGDEIIGLNRAFFYAGTKSIVSTLWRVDDLATSLFMKHFYRNYSYFNKIESLRNAQLYVKSLYPHPVYWAGISLSGFYE
ncbi:MAG TPA: CHAT domain-containing protein [bacterium]|nr:CHAT domain-containing protein [bacterium]HPQ19616.1 CHAT domain-containing protein [bacterium]